MKTWFTSDTHFGHGNIIEYCKRPFKSVERMNEVLIKNWNSRVKLHDLVIHLGDFAFRDKQRAEEYLSMLNGHITILRGNHDNNNSVNTRIIDCVVEIGIGNRVYCTHNPVNYSDQFRINLVGHVHNTWKVVKIGFSYLINVGVDVWNFVPIDFNEIFKRYTKYKNRKDIEKEIEELIGKKNGKQ